MFYLPFLYISPSVSLFLSFLFHPPSLSPFSLPYPKYAFFAAFIIFLVWERGVVLHNIDRRQGIYYNGLADRWLLGEN